MGAGGLPPGAVPATPMADVGAPDSLTLGAFGSSVRLQAQPKAQAAVTRNARPSRMAGVLASSAGFSESCSPKRRAPLRRLWKVHGAGLC